MSDDLEINASGAEQTPTPNDLSEHKEEVLLDGLRAWQAATVRLWSASEDAFAELILTWLPAKAVGAPWTARLHCGDKSADKNGGEAGEAGWVEDVTITAAASIQQALQKLWDRAKVRHGLFKDDPTLPTKVPSDFPADMWLTVAERSFLDRIINTLKRNRVNAALRLSYHPDRRPSARWSAVLHTPPLTPESAALPTESPTGSPAVEGMLHEVHAATLLYVCDALLNSLAQPPQDTQATMSQAAQVVDTESRALVERKIDTAIQPVDKKE